MYSCALWSDAENGIRGDLTVGPTEGDLEAAQERKIHYVLKQARLRHGDRLLEIGSGWGAMSITVSDLQLCFLSWSLIFIFYQAARMGCTVDTVTLSKEQKAETEIRALEAGVGDRVRVHLCDYRELPSSFEHAFDGFVSCEMIEVHIIYRTESWCQR
jgi:cyclopropane-fatty-acyl-phospholipid synthase